MRKASMKRLRELTSALMDLPHYLVPKPGSKINCNVQSSMPCKVFLSDYIWWYMDVWKTDLYPHMALPLKLSMMSHYVFFWCRHRVSHTPKQAFPILGDQTPEEIVKCIQIFFDISTEYSVCICGSYPFLGMFIPSWCVFGIPERSLQRKQVHPLFRIDSKAGCSGVGWQIRISWRLGIGSNFQQMGIQTRVATVLAIYLRICGWQRHLIEKFLFLWSSESGNSQIDKLGF